MEASWWEVLIVVKTVSCSDGQGHAQQIFNPIFCWWEGLKPNSGRGNGNLLQDLCQHAAYPRTIALSVSGLGQANVDPHLCQRQGLDQSLVGSVLFSPGSWCTQCFVCAFQESVYPVLWEFCNQIPLAFKGIFPGGS